jgi:hypothetical protein
MTLYVPSGSEDIITDTYLRNFWSQSCGYADCGCQPAYRLGASPGWHSDPNWDECATRHCCGGHGGCNYCIMTQSQAIADYQTEVTFITDPIGAQIFIDGTEWWPGAVTASDGATFRGIPPAIDPTPHTYDLRKVGYGNATGTFQVIPGITTTITVTLSQPFVDITVHNIMIGNVPCLNECDIMCTTPCPALVSIVVTWANYGNVSGTFTPSVTVTPPGTTINGTQITVVPEGTETTTFTGVSLQEGTSNVCFNIGIIT